MGIAAPQAFDIEERLALLRSRGGDGSQTGGRSLVAPAPPALAVACLLLLSSALTAGTGEIREPELVETPQGKRVAATPTVPSPQAAPEAEPYQKLEEVVIRGKDRSVLASEKREERDEEVLRGLGDAGPEMQAPDLLPACFLHRPPTASLGWGGEAELLISDAPSLLAVRI